MDLSQSKMPPQQGDSLLDIDDIAFNFGAHNFCFPISAHIAAQFAKCNPSVRGAAQ